MELQSIPKGVSKHAPQKHILIVDDESALIELFKTLFDGDGYRLTFADTGREAVSVLERGDVDLVITDKNLHDVNGLEILKIAKRLRPLTEVIIITGYASLDTVLVALEYDAFDYMLKPLHNIFDVKNKVRKALEKQDMALENQRLLKHLQDHARELELALAERKRVEAQLIQSEKLAGIGTLASGVAHEISSPLFGILGLAEAIVDESELEVIHGHAREIVEYSKQIREIVQNMSSYSRKARTEGLSAVGIRRVVEDTLRLVHRSIRLDGIQLIVEVPEGIEIWARANEIQQVLLNLIRNAVDALENVPTGQDRWVKVSGGEDAQDVWLEVADTGQGIPSDQVEQVFDPFFTTKAVGKGTGLGLNIVFRIVSGYGGNISVQSTLGKGSTFRIRFPKQER